jgi:glycosyltransferase involved in cell wall biosynthesis
MQGHDRTLLMDQRSIRVMHVVISLDPGGMENGVVNLANGLPEDRFATDVCCLEREGAFVARLSRQVSTFVLQKKAGFTPGAAARLSEIIRERRPHILHTHNLGPLIYAALATWGGWKTPILHGEHAQLATDELTFRRLWQRRILFHCTRRVHTVSQSLKQDLIAAGLPGARIEVLLNGVDTARFVPGDRMEARKIAGLPPDAFVFGMVGRFGPFKRHDLMIDAFEQLAPGQPHAHLLIVGGGGPEEERIRVRAAASAVAERIHLIGYQQDTAPFYRAMDMLVVPSTNEGLSNAVLEAMASGVPALCHAACGNAELIQHAVDGWITEIESANQLSQLLAHLAQQPFQVAAAGRAARKKIAHDFSLAMMIGRYAALYEAVAGRMPRRET